MASKYTDLVSKLAARNAGDAKKFDAMKNLSQVPSQAIPAPQTQFALWNPQMKDQANSFSATNNFYESLDPASLNQVKAANNSYDAYFQPNQQLNALLDQYMPWMSQELNNSNWLNLDTFKDVERQLNLQRENVLRQYWPNGEMQNKIKNFYTGMQPQLDSAYWQAQWALDQARDLNTSVYQGNVANMDTTADVSWASMAQVNASKAKADQDLAWNQLANAQASWDLQIKKYQEEFNLGQQEFTDYNNLYQNLNAYLDQYIQNYWNTRDKYLINNFNNLLNVKNELWKYLDQRITQQKALATDLATAQATSWQPVTATNPVVNTWAYKTIAPQTRTYETSVATPYDNQVNSWASNWFVYPWVKPDILLNKNVSPYKISEVKNPYSPKKPVNALANMITRR